MRPRKLTDQQEDELLRQTNLRNSLRESALCSIYSVSRATLRAAVKRAAARNAQVPA
jgi:DNA-binding GntR family transcriptional regulator